MGQERLTIETGALAAVALKGPLLHDSSWRLPTVVLDAQSCPPLYDPLDWQHARLLCPWDSPGKNTGMGCHSLLQGIFPSQRVNPGLLHCKQILYQGSYQVTINSTLEPIDPTAPFWSSRSVVSDSL